MRLAGAIFRAICKDVVQDWLNLIAFDGRLELCMGDQPIEAPVKHWSEDI